MSTFADMNLPQSPCPAPNTGGPDDTHAGATGCHSTGAERPGHYGTSQNRERENTGVFAADYRAGHATGCFCARAWPLYQVRTTPRCRDRSFWCWRPHGNWRSKLKWSYASMPRCP